MTRRAVNVGSRAGAAHTLLKHTQTVAERPELKITNIIATEMVMLFY